MLQGLVIENKADLYKVEIDGIIYESKARGKLKNNNECLVIGDIVEVEIVDNIQKKAVINNISLRKTYIKRPKISNITQIILVVSCKNPKPDLLMLDKQLAFAEYNKIKPIIVLNKADLDIKQECNKIKEMYEKIGYIVLITEAKNKKGIDKLRDVLKNNISVLAGNSGVGKSTLINDLFLDDITKEGEISIKNKRGKNTTTSSKLYKLDENTYIADTPRIFNIFYRRN